MKGGLCYIFVLLNSDDAGGGQRWSGLSEQICLG